jgi:hypothetical protein
MSLIDFGVQDAEAWLGRRTAHCEHGQPSRCPVHSGRRLRLHGALRASWPAYANYGLGGSTRLPPSVWREIDGPMRALKRSLQDASQLSEVVGIGLFFAHLRNEFNEDFEANCHGLTRMIDAVCDWFEVWIARSVDVTINGVQNLAPAGLPSGSRPGIGLALQWRSTPPVSATRGARRCPTHGVAHDSQIHIPVAALGHILLRLDSAFSGCRCLRRLPQAHSLNQQDRTRFEAMPDLDHVRPIFRRTSACAPRQTPSAPPRHALRPRPAPSRHRHRQVPQRSRRTAPPARWPSSCGRRACG